MKHVTVKSEVEEAIGYPSWQVWYGSPKKPEARLRAIFVDRRDAMNWAAFQNSIAADEQRRKWAR